MLLDSNIIIYAAEPEYDNLRQLIARTAPSVSAISYVEVLGYHQLTTPEKTFFTAFFDAATVIPLSSNILEKAVSLRQLKKMSLGDSLIAATALTHNLQLVTRNEQDFAWIPGLTIINPLS